MLTVLSPAKDLAVAPSTKGTQPRMLDRSELLVAKLRGYSAKRLGKLMDISPKLAELNHQRYKEWSVPFTTKNARPAVFTFNGEAYRGLNAKTLDASDLGFAQHHLRILSGLYGVLRPMDLMRPYRLEMGTALPTSRKKDLYAFWGESIAALLRDDLRESGSDVLVNLASAEYFKAVRPNVVDARVITPVFKDKGSTGYRMVMVFAKHQRGAMARHIIQHRLLDPEKLKQYTGDGYRFAKEESTANEWVFLRG
jgi:cytoplasmic iron level regulating protein YaaA (DUF328/UPF0246 family)